MSRVSNAKTLKRRFADTTSLAQSTKFGKARSSTVRIKSDADGNVTDVKDLKSVRFSEVNDDDSDGEGDMEFDSSGKLVVHDMEEETQNQVRETLAALKNKGKSTRSKYRRERRDAVSEKIQKEIEQQEDEKKIYIQL